MTKLFFDSISRISQGIIHLIPNYFYFPSPDTAEATNGSVFNLRALQMQCRFGGDFDSRFKIWDSCIGINFGINNYMSKAIRGIGIPLIKLS